MPTAPSTAQRATENEDWTKVASWDVRHPDGRPVETLDGLAEVLGVDPDEAAQQLVTLPFGQAAPDALYQEAVDRLALWGIEPAESTVEPEEPEPAEPEDEDKPPVQRRREDREPKPLSNDPAYDVRPEPEVKAKGGGPPLSTGAYVVAGSVRGRIDLVVRSGKVPGVEDDVTGSDDSPAARIVVYQQDGNSWKATGRKIAAKLSTLKRSFPLTKSGAKSIDAALVARLAEHEATATQPVPTGYAVKSVFDRGVAAWPGTKVTPLSREQWALGRVDAFLAAEGNVAFGYVRDLDLLPGTEGKLFGRGKKQPKWDENLHPRDRLGWFIEKGAAVRIGVGGSGVVKANLGDGWVEVTRDKDGQDVRVHTSRVTVMERRRGKPDRPASANDRAIGRPAAETVPDFEVSTPSAPDLPEVAPRSPAEDEEAERAARFAWMQNLPDADVEKLAEDDESPAEYAEAAAAELARREASGEEPRPRGRGSAGGGRRKVGGGDCGSGGRRPGPTPRRRLNPPIASYGMAQERFFRVKAEHAPGRDEDITLTDAAFNLHSFGTVYSVAHGHAGWVCDEYLGNIAAETSAAAVELCLVGLWERVEGGYRVLDQIVLGWAKAQQRIEQITDSCLASVGTFPTRRTRTAATCAVATSTSGRP